jgi:hypothetical protein
MNRSIRCGCHAEPSSRAFLADCGVGFTGLVLGAILHRDGIARAESPTANHSPDGKPHFSHKAKSVIWTCMLGGVSHLESFDPKPALNKYAGKTIAESLHKDVLDSPFLKANVRALVAGGHKVQPRIYPMRVGYRNRGRSGIEITDWWPHLGECIDDLAIVRSVWTTDNDHTAQSQLHTGRHIFDGSHPSIGAWVHHGLGSVNDNLPQFVVLSAGEPPGPCCGSVATYGAAYLGPEHAGVRLKTESKDPLPYAARASGVVEAEQRGEFELLQDLNGLAAAKYPDDPALRARIQSYELAFRMQRTVPEILRLEGESAATRKLYGIAHEVTKPFGNVCLTARRLVEKGVRFVQVYHGHGPASL